MVPPSEIGKFLYRAIFEFRSSSYHRFFADSYVGTLQRIGLFVLMFWTSIAAVGFAWISQNVARPESYNWWAALAVTLLVVAPFSPLRWLIQLAWIQLFYSFPACARGTCRDIDSFGWPLGYIFGRLDILYGPSRWHWYVYWCDCGDRYIRVGTRIFSISDEFAVAPYKKLRGPRNWVDDDGSDQKTARLVAKTQRAWDRMAPVETVRSNPD